MNPISIMDQINEAQRLASDIDGSCSPKDPNENRGMGAITIKYNPYESKWVTRADWSDNSKIEGHGKELHLALERLIDQLKEAVE